MIILSTHYLPNVEWIKAYCSGEEVLIDLGEHFQKQTFRNRTVILSANGPLSLTIPVKKIAHHTPMKLLLIENDFPWQHQHWQALKSAYGTAPYYEHYSPYFEAVFNKPFEFVHQWNDALLQVCLKLMKYPVTPVYSETYVEAAAGDIDLRKVISPKVQSGGIFPPYLQVFAEKFPFEPNLSIIDLLFNHGPRWREKAGVV